jgi:hypothetical protein
MLQDMPRSCGSPSPSIPVRIVILALLGLAACRRPLPRILPTQPCPSPTTDTEVVCVTRTSAGHTFTGSVYIRRADAVGSAVHARLAAARAWKALAWVDIALDRWQDAADAINHGIDELGDDYVPLEAVTGRETVDHTGTAIDTERLIEKSDIDPASVRRLMGAFSTRCALYVERNSDVIAEQWWRVWDGDRIVGEVGSSPGALVSGDSKGLSWPGPILHPTMSVEETGPPRLVVLAASTTTIDELLNAVRKDGLQPKRWLTGRLAVTAPSRERTP